MPKVPTIPLGGRPPVVSPGAVQQALKDAAKEHVLQVNSLEAYVGGPGGVRRYNTATHGAEGTFTHDGPSDDLGAFTFGPDGHLYAIAHPNFAFAPNPPTAPSVVKYDGQSGAFVGALIPALTDSNAGAVAGFAATALAFSPKNGDLYVGVCRDEPAPSGTGAISVGTVERYKIGAGAPSHHSGPLTPGRFNALAFGADGSLYVAASGSIPDVNTAVIFHFDDGCSLLGQFAVTSDPNSWNGLAVSGDTLYVAEAFGWVSRYDTASGGPLDPPDAPFIDHGGQGAYALGGLAFGPDGFLYANFAPASGPGGKPKAQLERYDPAHGFNAMAGFNPFDTFPIHPGTGLALRQNPPFLEAVPG